MPYIVGVDRDLLDTGIDMIEMHSVTIGQLNYFITKILLRYMRFNGGPSYTMYNTLVGVLECVKLEMYRRQISNYEDEKCDLNGDVYV